MKPLNQNHLQKALNGDINAFQQLFAEFQQSLKTYLYRLTADRVYAEDLTHDAFVKAFDKISSFKGNASIKTWVFSIATNLAYDHLRRNRRWLPDAQDQSKALAKSNATIGRAFHMVNEASGEGAYDMKEHIDFCFTCISKTLPIEQQVTLILKDVYDFPIQDICIIIERTEGVVKHFLHDARKTMTAIFDNRCALINKDGICNQCSELNGVFNPKQDQQAELMKLDLVKASKKFDRDELYTLRTTLVQAIDPLRGKGSNLEQLIMKCTRQAIGEIEVETSDSSSFTTKGS
jgi:RNA polymerase sigma-70 factor, ECF subfamily